LYDVQHKEVSLLAKIHFALDAIVLNRLLDPVSYKYVLTSL